MSSASDKGSAPVSQRLQEMRNEVLGEWAARVRAEVDGAAQLQHPILFNTIPALYDDICQALDPGCPRVSAGGASSSVALEHGGERARLTRYEIQSVIAEYQLLRETIFAALRRCGVAVGDGESQIIYAAFDSAIREAVTAFALVQSAFREQFFAALAHDLRGPLSNAAAAAQLIGRTDDLDKIRRHAGKIRDNIGRVDEMIRQMLDALVFHHGERLRLHPGRFDLRAIASEVCEHMALSHGRRFAVQGVSVQGWWSRAELERALENLVSNAVKYGASGTAVTITVASEHERVRLAVHNEGNPIPPDQIECVFQVFRRAAETKRGNAQGWGIGLSYVRSVAESHGGSVSVDSTPELGTTFTMDMPVDARPFQDAPTL